MVGKARSFCSALCGAVWVIFFAQYFHNTPADHPGVNDAERAYIQEKGDDQAKLPLAWGSMFRSPTLWCLCGMYLFSNAGWCFFITWDKDYYESVLRLGKADLGLGVTELMLANSAVVLRRRGVPGGGTGHGPAGACVGAAWGRTLQGFFAYLMGGCFFLLALAFSIGRRTPSLSCAPRRSARISRWR